MEIGERQIKDLKEMTVELIKMVERLQTRQELMVEVMIEAYKVVDEIELGRNEGQTDSPASVVKELKVALKAYREFEGHT